MNKMKKSLMATGGILAISASSVFGMGIVSAQSTSARGPASLIQKISQRFGLDEEDVKSVFDEERSAHQAEMRANFEDRLSQAVTDGNINEDQKTQILQKLDELHAYMDNLPEQTEDERREAMEAKMDELRQWAQDNNIPNRYLRPIGGHGFGMGHGPRNFGQ